MNFFTSPRDHLLTHLATVRAVVRLRTPADEKNANEFEAELTTLAVRHKAMSRARAFVFILLYASFVSAFVSDLPILANVLRTITALAGLVGVGLLSLLILYLTWRMTHVWNRMLVLYGHLISIYEKNNKVVYAKSNKY